MNFQKLNITTLMTKVVFGMHSPIIAILTTVNKR